MNSYRCNRDLSLLAGYMHRIYSPRCTDFSNVSVGRKRLRYLLVWHVRLRLSCIRFACSRFKPRCLTGIDYPIHPFKGRFLRLVLLIFSLFGDKFFLPSENLVSEIDSPRRRRESIIFLQIGSHRIIEYIYIYTLFSLFMKSITGILGIVSLKDHREKFILALPRNL